MPTSVPTSTPTVDPASVRADELGVVPVLMYHQVVPDARSVYDRTPADFRAELERLAADGFVPITAADFETGHIDVPAGKHPVVLTFDDGTASQFALGADGRPKPDTAVGILLDVASHHPGFTPTATMFVNGHPFAGENASALSWLHAHGFELGVHTVSHANLGTLDDAAVAHEIAANAAMISQDVPGYTPVSFALPFGIQPHNRSLATAGTSAAASYAFKGVYLVGSNPAASPFSSRFQPTSIPRIRSGPDSGPDAQFQSAHFLTRWERDPSGLFTSDGNPATISFPRALAGALAPGYAARARPY